ncbi:Crp/Fnr family transcriptional regulator [Chitinophaga barathri]|uniref:Crp/Fnr family transcriptional regulator n=1 Tax=Chitinophaga barathri TaxID=1647451 RepID=A0A3N4MHQ1_9BACT|nr:Crp/Fnr family transcriptional regulator [Chitinophaga barathri]RPD39169.1 Crp/Fnr family transcriptional regulator [Chitinophaga barathri]
MLTNLFEHIRKFVPLSEEEEQILAQYIEIRDVKKKDHLLKAGQVCQGNYFIIKGCCRAYFDSERDGEQIYHFAIENWWITDYISLEAHTPSESNIQALENTTYAVLYRDVQDGLFAAVPQLERYFRIILQKALTAAQLRVKYIFTQTGEERYHHFAGSFPDFVQRVPLYMIASYLGFTPEFISKIRAKKKA